MATSSCTRFRALAALSSGAVFTLVLHTAAVSFPAPEAGAVFTECADGIDNDNDATFDYPQDPQCLSLQDDSEGPTGRGLFLTVSDGLDTIQAGGSTTYTVSLRTEREGGKSVDVYFQMPHQTNLISASEGGYQQEELIVWKSVSVFPGTVKKLYVNVNITPYAQDDMLLVAQATSEGEKSTDTTRVEAASLTPYTQTMNLSVTDGKKYAQPGELLNYTISARNSGVADQTYTLRFEIPANTEVEYVGEKGMKQDNQAITWTSQKIGSGNARDYHVSVRILNDAKEFYNVRTRASIAAVSATDTTTVHTGTLPNAIVVSSTDGLTQATPGSLVTYDISLENTTDQLATEVDVNNALPSYMEFVDASEGGYWTGKNVRWAGLTVSPFGTRDLRVTGRVRSDAPEGAKLKNTVTSKGYEAVDYTNVGKNVIGHGMSGRQGAMRDVLITKTADKSEVRPGETVTYTVTIRNVTDHALSNIVVDDKMDSPFVGIVSAEDGQTDGSAMHWTIDSLASGQEWSTHYTARIGEDAPHGVEIQNIVSVSGDGMDSLSLAQRIITSRIAVVSNMPPTGAAFDAVFLAMSGIAGAVQTLAQRRKILLGI